MIRHFSLDLTAWVFLRNTLLVSLAALMVTVPAYVALVPGFAGFLLGGGDAPMRFLRQVVTNGLPVVLVINYVSFFLLAWLDRSRGVAPLPVVGMDIALRAALFVALHALIYMLSADWFGSFGGNRGTALRVVGPTLSAAAAWQNISGAYLYATLISAVPLYSHAVARSAWLGPIAARVPYRAGPVLLALLPFGLFLATVTWIARAVTP